jgi:hypothetical protein
MTRFGAQALNPPMTASDPHDDSLISYSHADTTWVWNWLRPRREAAGLRVCLDRREFDVGISHLENDETLRTVIRHARGRSMRQRSA